MKKTPKYNFTSENLKTFHFFKFFRREFSKGENSAFTLIELMTVLSIIAFLSSIVLASVNSARENGRIAANIQSEANILHGIGDQLIGEWKFDEGSGSAIDTSSFKNNGNVYSSIWNSTGGYNGKGAYQFTYGSSYIGLSNPKNLYVGSGDFTISAWVNYNLTSPVDSTIFFEGVPFYGNGQIIALNIANDKLQLSFYGPYATGGVTLPHNKWVFVTASYTAASTKASLYVNGALDRVVSTNGGLDTNAFNKNTIACAQIGRRYCFGGYMDFVGLIDNVRLYSSSLTALDIQNIYAQEKDKYADSLAVK